MRYLAVKDNYVIDVFMWDGVASTIYDGVVGITLIQDVDGNVGVGYRYNSTQEIFYLILNNIIADLPAELTDLNTLGAFNDITSTSDPVVDFFYLVKAGYVIDTMYWDGVSPHPYDADVLAIPTAFDYEGAWIGSRWDSVNGRFLLPMRIPSDMPTEVPSLPWDVFTP